VPDWLDRLCERVAARLRAVHGIKAIALGGSWARGTAGPDSDVDIAIYYEPEDVFALDALDEAARDLDDRHARGLVTRIGEWGEGVNGGGWLLIEKQRVDLLYRNLRRVREIVDRCCEGKPEAVYQLGHPMGFQTQIYMGEAFYCRPLYDPAGALAALKRAVAEYPAGLRRALIEKHLFDARFEIEIAAKPARSGDTMYVAGCLFRAAGFMTLVLYALNQRYFVNEKGAFLESRGFAIEPPQFHQAVSAVLGSIGNSPQEMAGSVESMRSSLTLLEDLCRSAPTKLWPE
jgi:predicted nucleotidyltransferase